MPIAPLVPPPLGVKAASVIVIDDASGKVLWSRDPDTPRYPASTTKIMTGLLLAERTKPGEIVVAPPGVKGVTPSIMNLKPGEKLSANDLLAGMMLRSANDGCVAAAVHVSGSVPAFVELMNVKARELGLLRTHFRNPNGLPNSYHVSTARDLATLGRFALRNERFAAIVRMPSKKIARSIVARDTLMTNRNRWLKKDPTAIGIKTGWTTASRNTYVGAVQRDFRMVDAILRTEGWVDDHAALVKWAYANWTAGRVYKAGEIVGETLAEGGASPVPVTPMENATIVRAKVAPEAIATIEIPAGLAAPVAKGTRVGTFVLTDAEGFRREVPLLAAETVERSTVATARSWWPGGLLLGGVALASRRRRRTGRKKVR